MRKYRILLMVHKTLVPPDDISGLSESEIDEFRTEHDVLQHAAPPRATKCASSASAII